MAVASMRDLANTGVTPLDKNLRYLSAYNAPILGDAKMKVINTQAEKYDRFVDNYGTPSFGNIGEGFNSIKSTNEQLEVTTYPVGFNIDVDRRKRTKDQIVDPRVSQLKAGMIGYGAYVSGKIFEGDPANPGAGVGNGPAAPFKGIRWYLDFPLDPGGARLDPAMKIDAVAFNGGTAIDLRAPVTSPNARAFMRLLDRMRYGMAHARASKSKVTFYLPPEIMIALPDIMRVSSAFKTTEDAYGREVTMYGTTIELKDAGLAAPSLSPLSATTSAARVLGWESVTGVRNDTLGVGAGVTYVSVYGVEHDADGFTIYSMDGQQQQDLGLLNDGVTYRTQVSDMLGLAFINPWCVTRAFGLLVA